jgi:hypothetical protein
VGPGSASVFSWTFGKEYTFFLPFSCLSRRRALERVNGVDQLGSSGYPRILRLLINLYANQPILPGQEGDREDRD